ncbi:MAG: 5'-deoxynucleotidase [Bacillota bacterium]
MSKSFFAYLNRMKLIERWSLMRSTTKENVMEHSAQVAQIAHALAIINNVYFNGTADANLCTTLAVFHETSEVITGDLPTPIKYNNAEIKTAYKKLEDSANKRLLTTLPKDMQAKYAPLISPDMDSYEARLAKAADRLAAYIKCIEELKSGNTEFKKAERTILDSILVNPLPEVTYFLEHFIPPFKLTLDELD